MSNVIVWDIETIPDLKGFAAANGHVGKSDDEVRAELGDKFPKHIYHSIICIGALVTHRDEGGRWIVDATGAPPLESGSILVERAEPFDYADWIFEAKLDGFGLRLIPLRGATRRRLRGMCRCGTAQRERRQRSIKFAEVPNFYSRSCLAS